MIGISMVCTHISGYVQVQVVMILCLTLILLSKLLCVSRMFNSLFTVLTSKKAQTFSSSRRSHLLTSSSSSSSSDSLQLLRSRVRCYRQTKGRLPTTHSHRFNVFPAMFFAPNITFNLI